VQIVGPFGGGVLHVRFVRIWIRTLRPGCAGATVPENELPATASVIRAWTPAAVPRIANVR